MTVLCALVSILAAGSFTALPAGWVEGGRAAPSEPITLHIFLSHDAERVAKLTEHLHRVAEPASVQYGEWLNFDEVNALTTPANPGAVERWLAGAGITASQRRSSPAGDILALFVNVSVAEKLLPSAQYVELKHAERGLRIVRTAEFALPASLEGSVDFVAPTTRVPRVLAPLKRSAPAAETVAPPALRAMYGATRAKSRSPNNSFAVVGFLAQYFDPTDVAWFFSHYDRAVSSGDKIAVHGPNKPASSGEEATLDVSYGAAMAAGVPTTFWSTAGAQPGSDQNEPFAQWLSDLASDPAPPLVFSISYSDDEYTVNPAYAQRVSIELQKAGVRGISIISSSGDGGVGGTQPNNKCKHFLPTFPASSPYATAVGGTSASGGASSVFPSGGGFSNLFGRPAYQESAVAAYLAQGKSVKLPSAALFNSSGAAYPDVSLLAENFVLGQYKVPVPVSGTSCSTPAFAALVSLLNDVRLAAGKRSLGWLNPLLYAHADDGSFTDVVSGANPGCAVNSALGYLGTGFQASKGWDPATGLGTIVFDKWAAIVKALP